MHCLLFFDMHSTKFACFVFCSNVQKDMPWFFCIKLISVFYNLGFSLSSNLQPVLKLVVLVIWKAVLQAKSFDILP